MAPDFDDRRERELDLELRPAEAADEAPSPRRTGTVGALVILGLLAAGLAIGFYWRPSPLPPASPESVAAAADAPAPSEVPTEFGPVPPLDESDEFVRALVRQLSSRPELVAWMAGPNLARTVVAAVDKIAIGSTPVRELRPAAPEGSFQTLGTGSTLRIDPRSYERYNTVANVVDAIDADGAARVYRRLRPLLQEAFEELGYTNLAFDERLALALGWMVNTPVLEGEVPLRATSVTFQFADPELEALSPVQKQLLRMGPRNMRLIQSKLRAFARAAGLTRSAGAES